MAVAVACATWIAAAAPAEASSSTKLVVVTRGLPPSTQARIDLRGPGLSQAIGANRVTLSGIRPGRYVARVHDVRIHAPAGAVRAGAVAYPVKRRLAVRVRIHGKRSLLVVAYSIVNPRARPFRSRVRKVVGDSMNPTAVVFSAHREPRVGTILASGPRKGLPGGLLSRVTSVTSSGGSVRATLKPAPLSEAVPQLSYVGDLRLSLAAGARQEARASGASCVSPSLLTYGAHLDAVNVREAFVGAWPPQMRFTLAVRTTERLGVAAAAAGVNCDFDLGQIGPYQGAIPVGPIVVPVYATFPIRAGIHINGKLNVGTFHVASTTVARAAAGFNENAASLREEGTNVWITGSPSISGSAKLSASIALEAGIGLAKGANAHARAAFGPVLSWASGARCSVDVNMGALTAGVSVFGKNLNTPAFTPFKWHIWDGCAPAAPGDPGGGTTPPGGGGTTPPGGGGTTPPGGGGSVPAGTRAETVGGVTHTWTNYTNAGGTQGPSIPKGQTVGVACKVQGFKVADGNTWWYRIASSPWNGAYYASADAFYNNGQASGPLQGTPFVDPAVPDCNAPPPPAPPTWAETVGGVTHTWTNYTNAGGTQGPSIQKGQTVAIACKLQGFRVADGNTWWYRIASSPWNGAYYASADAFYNNGQISGPLQGTPFVDTAVANC